MSVKTEALLVHSNDRRAVLIPILIIALGLIAAVNCSRWMDVHKVSGSNESQDELYLSDATLKRLSLGFNGLVADWYWMRALQYVGQRIINHQSDQQLDNLGALDLKLLAPLLDRSTTLDPHFMEPYEYAAVVLPDVDLKEAIRLTRKGMEANPTDWRLPQYLAYVYWQQGDFKTAAEIYGHAAQLPYAPYWLTAMKAQMLAGGGSRDTARSIYNEMYLHSEEPLVREMARKRILQVQSLDERDLIRRIISNYSARNGHCPASFREIAAALHETKLRLDSEGVPVDPADFPYQLVENGCEVDLDPHSEVPAK